MYIISAVMVNYIVPHLDNQR